VVRFPSKRLGN
jgi:hypothetical protein